MRLHNNKAIDCMSFDKDVNVIVNLGEYVNFLNISKYEDYTISLKNDFPHLFW